MRYQGTIVSALIMAVLWSSGGAKAADFRKIEGDYTIATPDGGTEVEFGLIITGEAAERLYGQLPLAATKDLCTGGLRKDHPTGMQCTKDGKEFTCSLGYRLKSGQTTPGPLTC